MEMVGIFWILLPALFSLLILLEIINGDGSRVNEILKRTVLCVLLLLSFKFTINLIATVIDGVTHAIGREGELLEVLKKLGPINSDGPKGLFDIKEHILYFFSIAAYLVAYIGFFASIALMNFVWAILYIASPLILLCYIPRTTASIVSQFYRSLVHVAVWKVMWTLLGSLLLKMALDPKVFGVEDYFLSIVMNLLIGLSMLLVPIFTKSLISDGLQNMASGLAAAPGILAANAGSIALRKAGRKFLSSASSGLRFATKPPLNVKTGKMRAWARKMKLQERFQRAKNAYEELGLPRELKKGGVYYTKRK